MIMMPYRRPWPSPQLTSQAGFWHPQALHQKPPLREPGQAIDMTARIERRQVLGGLISEYRRAA